MVSGIRHYGSYSWQSRELGFDGLSQGRAQLVIDLCLPVFSYHLGVTNDVHSAKVYVGSWVLLFMEKSKHVPRFMQDQKLEYFVVGEVGVGKHVQAVRVSAPTIPTEVDHTLAFLHIVSTAFVHLGSYPLIPKYSLVSGHTFPI